MIYLIIGNGVAGTEAALNLKNMNPDADVDIITESSHRFYFRPRLIECLDGSFDYDTIYIHSDEYYLNKGIRIQYNTKVDRIDLKEKKVFSSKGASFSYDRLLIATGASPFVPPIRNMQLEGFFTLRTIDDAKKINSFCTAQSHVVIAGGGLLGLECAYSLKKAVGKLTVVETEAYLLPRQLDEEGGRFLEKRLRAAGLEFVFGDRIDLLEGEHLLQGVRLSSGGRLDTDALVVSTGIRSECSLAAECGLAVERGIVVNTRMQSPDESVFAAGDCAQVNGRVYGLWMPSKEQGRIAAKNMAGDTAEFQDAVQPVVLKIPGVDLFCAGDMNKKHAQSFRISNEDRFVHLLAEGSTPAAVTVIGDKKMVSMAGSLMQGKLSIDDFITAAGM